MAIAIVSDIHDHVWNLAAALPELSEADAVLCCGDLCSPFVLAQLAAGVDAPVHVVFGNNDGDQYRLTTTAADFAHVHLHGSFFRGEVAGVRVAMSHYPSVARALDPTDLDLIVYGHDHVVAVERRAGALLVNPGPLMGYAPADRADVAPTFVTFDVERKEATRWEIGADGVAGTP